MANVEVGYDHVVQELQERQTNSEYLKLKFNSHMECRQTNSDEQKQTDMVKIMEDIQFNSALLRNGILAEATEFELARQYDDTLARKGSQTKDSVNHVDTFSNVYTYNLKQIGEHNEQTVRLLNNGGGMPTENCLGQASSIVSVYSCAEEVNACESSCAKDSGVSDLTVAATRRLSALVIHTGKDFEIMSVEEQDLDDRSSTHSRELDQLDLARSVEKCKEMFELDGSYFSFDGHMRTSTPVEGSRLELEERESEPRKEKSCFQPKKSKANSSQGGLRIRAVLARGRKKVGDGIIHGFASLMAAIL